MKNIGLLLLAVVMVAGMAGCSDGDDSNFRMQWINNHSVEVTLQIEGEAITWCGDDNPDKQSLLPGASRTTCLSYPAGHYEYMVFEKKSRNPVICEGRFDLDANHKNFEAIPVAGGSSYVKVGDECGG